jgi:hypothetical protein
MRMGEESQLQVLPRLIAGILRRTSSVRLRMTPLREFFRSLLNIARSRGHAACQKDPAAQAHLRNAKTRFGHSGRSGPVLSASEVRDAQHVGACCSRVKSLSSILIYCGMSCPHALHLVAAEVVVGEAFQPVAQLLGGTTFGDRARHLRALQHFFFHENRAIHAQR